MKLKQSFPRPKKPYSDWLELERNVNDGSPNRRTFTDTSSIPTSPARGLPAIPVPLILAPPEDLPLELIGNGNVYEKLFGDCIPIHPDVYATISSELKDVVSDFCWGIPTASPRTLLLLDEHSRYFIKLHYGLKLGRFPRMLAPATVERSIAVSDALDEWVSHNKPDWSYLREPSAAILRHRNDFVSSTILRDVHPALTCSETCVEVVVPLFSIVARHRADGLRVLRTISSALQADEVDTVAVILELILHSFFDLACEMHLLPEAHAQNVLLFVIDGKLQIVWRDLQGFIRDGVGDFGAEASKTDSVRNPDFVIRSLRYDWYLGHYVLEPLREIAAMVGMPREVYTRHVKAIVAKELYDHDSTEYFRLNEWWEFPLNAVEYGQRVNAVKFEGETQWR